MTLPYQCCIFYFLLFSLSPNPSMVTNTLKDERSILQNPIKIATRHNFFIESSNTLDSPISVGGKFEWKYLVWATLIFYTKNYFLVSPILFVLLNIDCYSLVPPTLNATLMLYLSFLVKIQGITHLNNIAMCVKFSSTFQPSMIIFHYKNVRMQDIPNFVSVFAMDFMHYATYK